MGMGERPIRRRGDQDKEQQPQIDRMDADKKRAGLADTPVAEDPK
jgi:hypothetical protein